MQQTQELMGMHVTVDVRDGNERAGCDQVFSYLKYIDETFSTYKPDSEVSKINRGELQVEKFSADVKEIFRLAEETKKETRGYFDIQRPDGTIDPSGIVKGWAIWQASVLLEQAGHHYFFVDVGGDIQAQVADAGTQSWRLGICNPFQRDEIIKVLRVTNEGVATSGTAERGSHIYNPHNPAQPLADIVSVTVVGPTVYEADRFATAAFAMGAPGILFIESISGCEGYMIDRHGVATMTRGFQKYVTQ